MTIQELAKEYSRSAALVWERITELERAMEEADEITRLQLDGRVRPLRNMSRDTRRTARYLERYYLTGKGGAK